MLYYVESGVPGAWADPDNILSTVVDPEPGQPFEAQAVDVNRDGESCSTYYYSLFWRVEGVTQATISQIKKIHFYCSIKQGKQQLWM